MEHVVTVTENGNYECTCGLMRDKNGKRLKRSSDPMYQHSYSEGINLTVSANQLDSDLWDIWED